MRKLILFLINITLITSLFTFCRDKDGVCEGKNAIVCLFPFLGAGSSYSIGGTITGLTADGLVLQNNASDDLTVAANETTFTFATKVSGTYAVTVKTQPTGLTCAVSNESGTATADVSNVEVACTADSTSKCTSTSITRDWGTFTDCENGIVELVVNAGTYGGNTYTSKTLYFSKCVIGETYDSSTNSCSGTGTDLQYCDARDNSCNGGTNAGTLDGSGNSALYTACNDFNLEGKSWRVPTKDEAKLLIECTENSIPNDGILRKV